MSGQAWKYSDQLDDMDLKMMKRDFFTYKIGMDYYGFSIRPLMRIAREAGAFYKIGKIVLINRECFDAYLRKTRCKEEIAIGVAGVSVIRSGIAVFINSFIDSSNSSSNETNITALSKIIFVQGYGAPQL